MAYTHTRSVKQNGQILNNIANFVNSGIKAITGGAVDPKSGFIFGNGTATVNAEIKITGPFQPKNTGLRF
jgi:hypothetical protein